MIDLETYLDRLLVGRGNAFWVSAAGSTSGPAQMAILPSLVGQARERQRTRGPRLFLMLELYGLSSRSP